MLVPVLITSCQVSEKLKCFPSRAHKTTNTAAPANAQGEPSKRADVAAALLKELRTLVCVACVDSRVGRCVDTILGSPCAVTQITGIADCDNGKAAF